MPSALHAIFGADATPYAKAMRTVELSTKGMANLTVGQMQRAIAEIEKRAAAEVAAGRSTGVHAQMVAQLTSQMQALAARTAAATAAQEMLAKARAKAALGMNLSPRDEKFIVAGDRTAAAAARTQQTAFRNPEAEKRQLRQRFLQEEAPGFTGPRSLTGQQRLDVGIDTAARDNRLRALQRQRAEERAGREQAKADAIAQGLSEQKAAEMAKMAWIRSLRERRAARAQERADIAATAQAEERAARLASIGWIRSLRERRSARAQERAEAAEQLRQTTGLRGFFNQIGGGLTSRFLGIGAAIGAVYTTGRFIAESYRAVIATERLQNTFKSILGSASAAGDELKRLRQEADRTGFVFLEVAPRVANFMAAAKEAGLAAGLSQKISSAVLNAGASLGLDAGRQSEALLALEQMMSRGSVMSQELRLQWGNAMPGGLSIFAKALGVTNGKLLEMVESGTLLSKDVMPKVADQLNKMFPPNKEANESLKALAAYQNALNDFKTGAGELLKPISTTVLGTSGMAMSGVANLFKFETWQMLLSNAEDYQQMLTNIGRLQAGIRARIEGREAAKEKPGARDAEANAAAGLVAKQMVKEESALNKLLLQRATIQDLLNDKAKLSATVYREQQKALADINQLIANATAGKNLTPLQQARLDLNDLVAAERKLIQTFAEASAKAVAPGQSLTAAKESAAARTAAREALSPAFQQTDAKRQEIALLEDMGLATNELNRLLLRRIELEAQLGRKSLTASQRADLRLELADNQRAIAIDQEKDPKKKAQLELEGINAVIARRQQAFRERNAMVESKVRGKDAEIAAATDNLERIRTEAAAAQKNPYGARPDAAIQQERMAAKERIAQLKAERDALAADAKREELKGQIGPALQARKAKEQEISLLEDKPPRENRGQKITQFADEFERAGGGIGFGTPPMALLDVNKAQLTELREINRYLNRSAGRAVRF